MVPNEAMKTLVKAFVPTLFGTLLCTLQPAHALTTNLVPMADTTLFQTSPDNNLGANVNMIAGTTAAGARNRALIKFNLSQLPAGATITSAMLTLNVVKAAAGPGSTFALHRVLRDWGEGRGDGNQGMPANDGEATWNNRFHPVTGWTAAGAAAGTDYATDSSASSPVDASGNYAFGSTVGLVADAQDWLNNSGSNLGWILISSGEVTARTARRIGAREDPANTPTLTIGYTVPELPAPAAPPTIFATARDGNNIRFSFNAQSNRTYAVEFLDSLSVTNWSVLTNIPALPANATVQITNPVDSAQRYFRARTP